MGIPEEAAPGPGEEDSIVAKTRPAPTLPLLLAALALACLLAPARTAFADRYAVAVIVGNRDYQHERVPDVAFAHRDAAAFRRYVLDVLGFDPNRVFDLRDATQAELFTWFGNRDSHEGRLWRYLHPRHGSDVVVFYSGHGVPGLKDRRGYLLPADADPDTPEINGYPIDLLYANLGKPAEARSVRVFLDACFSGESDRGMLIRSASPVVVTPELPGVSGEKLTVLTAASGADVASWDEKARHGMFTHHLLDALYGKGDLDGDGEVTAAEAKTYLDDTMTIAARVEFGRNQFASLNGVVGAVLARAGEGGAFPARPALEGDEAGAAPGDAAHPGPPVEANAVERDKYLLGLERAFASKDFPKVLEFAGRLEDLGGVRPASVDYFRAEAEFHADRFGDAVGSLERYVAKAGREGTYYRRSLELLLILEERDDAAFARATASGTAASFGAYLSSFPQGRHVAEAGQRESALRAEEVRRRLEEDAERRGVAAQRAAAARADDDAFAEAKTVNTPASYQAYLDRGGRHAAKARVLLDERAASVEAALGLTHGERVSVQHGLLSLGHDIGVVDGAFGRRTRAGIEGYQRAKGLQETGYLTGELRDALVMLGERRREDVAAREVERRRLAAEREHREAARRADDDAFAEAKRLHTPAGYRSYLDRGGRHESAARALLAEVPKPKLEVGKKFRDCPDCPEMVVVPSGSYEMGSPSDEGGRFDDEGPVHPVTIAKPFAVGVHEVTRGEWSRFVSGTGYVSGGSCWTYEGGEWKDRAGRGWRNPGFSQGDVHPVVCVSWADARAYVEWLSGETGEEYRLLSESQWEWAARGGSSTSRYWGVSENGQCTHANGADRSAKVRYGVWTVASCDDGHVHTSPVGNFRANGYGLHDVLGNVWEWVEDCWHDDYVGAPSDEGAWTSGGDCGKRVLRGGSWVDAPRYLRSAHRFRVSTVSRSLNVGFRVSRTLD